MAKDIKKGKKKTGRIVLVAALVIVVLLIVNGVLKGNKAVSVESAYPQITSITQTIPANGKVQPVIEVKISPDVSGEIVELNVKEGDFVHEGDLLLKIKQDVYQSAVERAEASLNSTRAQYQQQKAQMVQLEAAHARAEKLLSKQAIAKSEYESAKAQYEAGKEQLRACEYNIHSYQAALKEARENLVKTTIYAPMDGTISKLSVEKGERVVGTGQMAGTEMLRIADLGNMEVMVDVNENDIIKIGLSDSAVVEVDAYPDTKFKGLVTQIASSSKSAGTSVDQVTNFEVKVLILPESYQHLIKDGSMPLRPGMSASVSIETLRHDNALVIPLQAITTRSGLIDSLNYGSAVHQQVFVVENGKVQAREIRTGIQDVLQVEVTDGIDKDTKIVTGPFNAINKELKSGTKVSEK